MHLDSLPPEAHRPADPPGGTARSRGRWGAIVLGAVLVAATVGAIAFAVYQFNRAEQRDQRAAELEIELAMLDASLAQTSTDRDQAQADASARDASLAEAVAQLQVVSAEKDRLAALFPMTPDRFRTALVEGTYLLEVTPIPEACVGFSDPGATCVAANFPTDLVVIGTPESLSVASTWFDTIDLTGDPTGDADSWTGTGALYESVSNTCGGEPNATTVEITLAVDSIVPTLDQTAVRAGRLSGRVTFASGETDRCTQATRAADFVTVGG